MCSACVCVRVHTFTHTYTPTRVKMEKTQDNTSSSPSVQNISLCQATSTLHRPVEHPNPRRPKRMSKLRTNERMCTPCCDCFEDMYVDVKNTCGMYTPACTGVQDNCLVHTTLTANMHIHPRKHASAMAQQTLRCRAGHPQQNSISTPFSWEFSCVK